MIGVVQDVTARHRAEEHLHLMVNELNHRVKNTLAIVQAIAHQTLRGAPPEARTALDGRLMALSSAHNLLTAESWEATDLAAVVHEALDGCSGDSDRFQCEGPHVRLEPKTAVTIAMALHELCTNATKYGALSNPEGRVSVTWRVEDGGAPRLRLTWRERGGPPVSPPERRGFGSRMIERALAAELQGTVRLDFDPEGLVCEIDAPLPRPAADVAQEPWRA
jgi:two-component sensor histidine kinase